MKTIKNILVIIAILLVSGCDETKKVIDTAGNIQLSGSYTITSLGENAVSGDELFISFFALDKTVRGNTGCNSFFGNYALDLYALSFSEIGSTEKACETDIMDNEIAFLNALNNTGSYTLQEKELTLFSKVDRSVLLKAMKNTRDQE